MKDDCVYLKHILRSIARIEEYTAGGRQSFFDSHLIQDGVLRQPADACRVEPAAESEGLKASQPSVDWKGLRGFGMSWRTTILASTSISWTEQSNKMFPS